MFLILFFLHSELIQGELFRDPEHNYRIRFPSGWEIVDGDGEHIKKKAIMILIIVFRQKRFRFLKF